MDALGPLDPGGTQTMLSFLTNSHTVLVHKLQGDFTVKELLDWFAAKGLVAYSVSCGQSLIYNNIFPKHKARMPTPKPKPQSLNPEPYTLYPKP